MEWKRTAFGLGVGVCKNLNLLGPQGDSEDESTAQTHTDRERYAGLQWSAHSALTKNLQNKHHLSPNFYLPVALIT